MRHRSSRGYVLPLLAFGILALDASAQVTATRDSAGITILENPRPRVEATVRISARPLLTIGTVSGTDGTAFGLILSARILPTGDVAVVDLHDPRVRVFDGETGAMLSSIGRQGPGPGEFAAAPSISVSSQGSIWAWDPGNQRVTEWSAVGDQHASHSLGSHQVTGLPNARTLNAWEVSRSGLILSLAALTLPSRDGPVSRQTIRLFGPPVDRPVQIGDVATVVEASYGPSTFLESPFTPKRAGAIANGRVYVSRAGPWQVDVFDQTGAHLAIIRSDIPRTAITADLVAKERRAIENLFDSSRILDDLMNQIAEPDSTSAISDIVVSSDGELWVTRWSSPYAARRETTVDVLNTAGRWLRTVQLPQGAGRLADVGFGRLITIWRDENDVPFVSVYALPQ